MSAYTKPRTEKLVKAIAVYTLPERIHRVPIRIRRLKWLTMKKTNIG
jgi:hypothetical protein